MLALKLCLNYLAFNILILSFSELIMPQIGTDGSGIQKHIGRFKTIMLGRKSFPVNFIGYDSIFHTVANDFVYSASGIIIYTGWFRIVLFVDRANTNIIIICVSSLGTITTRRTIRCCNERSIGRFIGFSNGRSITRFFNRSTVLQK